MPLSYDEELNRLRAKYRKQHNLDPIRAQIGDESGNTVWRAYPGKVIVRVQSSNGLTVAIPVWPPAGKTVSLKAGTNVLLEYDKFGNIRIAEPDTSAGLANGLNPITAIVQPQPTTRTPQQQLETLAVLPTSVPSLKVIIKAWQPVIDLVEYDYLGGTADLTAFVPATDEMCYAVVLILADLSGTEIFASTPRDKGDIPLGKADRNECLAQATAGSTPVYAIKLVGDQTAITMSDIVNDGVDMRGVVNVTGGNTTYVTSVAATLPLVNTGTSSAVVIAMQGITGLAQGDLLYGASANTFGRLTKDANDTRYLSNTGATNNPAWAQIDLTNGVTGTLPVANGGTGLDSTSQSFAFIGPTSGSGAPTWRALVSGDIPTLTQYLVLAGQAGGQTANGGTAASENLTLVSTAHATKGNVVVAAFATFKQTSNQLLLTNGTKIVPSADSTSTLIWTKADGTTQVAALDTTNSYFTSGSYRSSGSTVSSTGNVTYGCSTNSTGIFFSGGDTVVNVSANNTNIFSFSSTGAGTGIAGTVSLPSLRINTGFSPSYGFFSGSTFVAMTVGGLEVWRGDTSGNFGIGATPGTRLHVVSTVASAASVTMVQTLEWNPTSGTPAAGFGVGLQFLGKSSTTPTQNMAFLDAEWFVATHLSRQADFVAKVYDTAAREIWRGRGSGSAPMIGFLGATPVVQQANTVGLETILSNFGFRATGGSAALDTKLVTYNAIATEGYGVPAIVDDVALTAQVANIGSTNFTNAGATGMYEVSYYLYVTTTDVTAGTIPVAITWNDGTTAQTFTSATINLAVAGSFANGAIYVRRGSGNVAYSTTITGIYGTAVYALYMTCKRLS